MSSAPLSIALLVSGKGRGTNLQALLDACAQGTINGRVSVVIGAGQEAPAMERARLGGAEAVVISPKWYANDESAYGDAVLNALRRHDAGLICLAGYMRKLPHSVVTQFAGRILNVHAALLPLFGGKGMYGEHVHRAVIESGVKVTGCTVHFVDENYDTGPIVVQTAVPVLEEDTPESLGARVLPEEQKALVKAVMLFADNRLRIDGRKVRVLDAGGDTA